MDDTNATQPTERFDVDETTITSGFSLPQEETPSAATTTPNNGETKEETPNVEPQEKLSNGEAKKRRLAEKQAKENRLKAEKLDKLLAAISPDDESKEGEGDVDPIELTLSRLEKLERRAELAEWERDNRPADLTEAGQKAWKEALESKNDPDHPYHKLSYSDLWKLASPEVSSNNEKVQEVEKQIKSQEDGSFLGSIPVSSRSGINNGSLSDFDREIATKMGWSESDYKDAGVL